MNTPRSSQSGITLVEMLVSSVIGALVVAGAFRLWKSNHEEGYRIQKKTELRDRMALSSKRIQRSITLAGLGISKAPILVKSDAVGSDTLTLYINVSELKSALYNSATSGQMSVHITNPAAFYGKKYIVVSNGSGGEVRAIDRVSGHYIMLLEPLERNYPVDGTTAYPARRETYFTNQAENRLIRVVDGTSSVMAENIRNFQVSFRDGRGVSIEDALATRTVHFSFTGVYPARPGAPNSMVFTSTAIPRNVL